LKYLFALEHCQNMILWCCENI